MSTTEAKPKQEYPEKGMWECEFTGKKGANPRLTYAPKGEKRVYHASTATALAKKGFLKIGKEIKEYRPKTMKE